MAVKIHALLITRPGTVAAEEDVVRLVERQPVTIGRSRTCDVRLADSAVSSRHLRLVCEAGELIAEDLGSRNGTWVLLDGQERRLSPGAGEPVANSASLRVGPYRLTPCESLGGRLLLTDSQLVRPSIAETGSDGEPAAAGAEWLSLVIRTLRRAAVGEPWREILDGLLALTGSGHGYLLSVGGGGVVVKAGTGSSAPTCISRTFIEAVLERKETVVFRPAEDELGLPLAESLLGYGADSILVGVCFPGSSGLPVALGYVELTGGGKTRPDELTRYAELAAPFLELAGTADRESRRRAAAESALHDARATGPGGETGRRLIGNHAEFRAAVETALRAAPTPSTLLIRGPSGSGKDELARLVHEASPRKEFPLVALNAAAIPEQLVESELFGFDRGAFTGANETRLGAFESADGGTLFLDEIGDLPLSAQAKILRVLEGGQVVRLGGSRRRVDIRFIAATHRDLEEMIEQGTFRLDLYYRLRVVEVTLPPLAARREDVVPLAEHFLDRLRKPAGSRIQGMSIAAARALTAYDWPGNIRELRNVVERAVVLDRDGVLDLDDLPADVRGGGKITAGEVSGDRLEELLSLPWPGARNEFERLFFLEALRSHSNRVKETARAVGVDRRTLSNKIRRHHLRDH